jgi:hypothetical protein
VKAHYSKSRLADAVAQSKSIYQVLDNLGLKKNGGNHSQVKRWINKHGLDTSHFLGCRVNSGSSHIGGPRKLLPDEVLVANRTKTLKESVIRLRRALDAIGRPRICRDCGVGEVWNKKPLTLQIEHINGNNLDNRRENLTYLCPNCHTQTLTWGSRNGDMLKSEDSQG